MLSPRLIAVITALSLVNGAMPAMAQFTLAELQQIEQLIAAKDRFALWLFLHNNPQYMTGDDPLAVELRAFYQSAYDEMIRRLSVPVVQAQPVPGGSENAPPDIPY